MTFFNSIKDAAYSFTDIFAFFAGLWQEVMTSEGVSGILSIVDTALAAILPFLPFIYLALGVVVLFFGQRLLGVLRFLAVFFVGFVAGVYYLAPIITFIPNLPPWVVGLVVGIVAAVLSKLVYFLAYIVCAFYSVYLVCMTGLVVPEIAGNYIVALIVAGIALILALLLKKIIERVGTAFLGGYAIASVVKGWYDFTSLEVFAGYEWLVMLSATLLLTLIGFIVQQKTRRRY